MTNGKLTAGVRTGCVLLSATYAQAQDWPQLRGTNRDAKVTGFKAPKEWPKELKEGWKIKVGDGVATPALVGDKLYVFTHEGGKEVLRCLKTSDGSEIWKEAYEEAGLRGGPDSGFSGPRSSPAVAEGKVVTLGVNGKLYCREADSGKEVWHKTDVKGAPQFHVASSPMIVDGLCIVQMGGNSGPLAAYELADGKEKWKCSEGSEYASPVLFTADKTKMIVAETGQNIIGVSLADGKVLWKTPFSAGRMQYNASTPMVEGDTVIFSGVGRGTKAVKVEKSGDEFKTKELWSNSGASAKFNTPVVKDGLVFGLTTDNKPFCLTADGKTAWTAKALAAGGGGGRMGGGGYGSVVDAGSVLFALTPAGELIVYEPSDKEFKELAKYKVGTDTYAYPIVSGNRIFVKDKDSLILWAIE